MHSSDRYGAPTARVVDPNDETSGGWAFGIALMIALAVLWRVDFPRSVLSPLVSSHFPWPGHGSRVLTWTALCADRLLIEASVCLPAAMLLAYGLPSRAVLFSALLAFEEVARTSLEVLLAPSPKQRAYLLLALSIHALLLIGGTALFRARRRPRLIAAPFQRLEAELGE